MKLQISDIWAQIYLQVFQDKYTMPGWNSQEPAVGWRLLIYTRTVWTAGLMYWSEITNDCGGEFKPVTYKQRR